MRHAHAYIRVSTSDQHLGPEAQRSAIEAWAAREGVAVVGWHVDHGVSGAAPLDRRPGLLSAVGALQRGDILVAAKRDRIARDVVVAATLERVAAKAGASVTTADGIGADDDSPEAKLLRTMVDAFAQYERGLISARTRSALRVKRARGERTGQVPLGFRLAADGLHLEPDPDEQRAAARARELRLGGLSLRRVAEALNAEGWPSRGARWRHGAVSSLLSAGMGGLESEERLGAFSIPSPSREPGRPRSPAGSSP